MTGRPFLLTLIAAVATLILPVLLAAPDARAQAWFRTVPIDTKVGEGNLNCIHQDHDGMIWLGTAAGLYTFDGLSFTPVVLPGNFRDEGPTALFTDHSGNLWIGFENGGVLTYDGFEVFDTVLSAGRENVSRITGFVEGEPGTVWMATYGSGAFVSRDTAIVQMNSESGLSDNYIYSIVTGPGNRIWMGTDNGINVAGSEGGAWKVTKLSIDEGLPDFIVQCLAAGDSGSIWIGMYDRGICRYDQRSGTFHVPENLREWQFGAVRDMVILEDRIWIATSDRGIMEYSPETGTVTHYRDVGEQTMGRIKSMLRDQEGNIWLLSGNELYLSFGNRIEFFQSIGGMELNNIHALTVDSDDQLWFADDRGIYSYDPGQPGAAAVHHPLIIDLDQQKVMSIYRDYLGFIWVGTFGSGLVRMDPGTGRQVVITERDGLVNGNVLSITGNRQEIWFGTLGGASRCIMDKNMEEPDHVPTFQNFGSEEGLVNNYIYQVFLPDDGTPYFATDGSGVHLYRDGEFLHLDPGGEMADKVVYSVARDDAGNTWLNIAGEGLHKYDGTSYSRISREAGRREVTISGILSSKGELVMAHENGIDVMNISTGAIRHFEENAGIAFINPDLNTLARDSHHALWIGTAKGIIRIRPLEKGLWEQPRTKLEGVALFLEPFNHSGSKQFNHNENHLSFNYSGFWYQQPDQVEYQVKLDGHDLGWIRTRNNQVIYSDLRPGEYTFRVRSGLYGNFSAAGEEAYTFTIRKPFHSSIWFYILLVLAAGGLTAMILTARIRQVRRKEELIQEKIRFQFENLKSQINPHFLFNSFSTLIALIEDDTKAAVNYVEELSMLFRIILEYKDQDLVSLDREYEIAGNYINLQKKRYGSNLVVEMEEPSAFRGTKIPPLTLQLLIENAIKHNVASRGKPLRIKIFSKPGENRIFVENNIQEKLQDTPSTGIGINNIISRYKLLTDEEVMVIKTEHAFTVGLPFIP